MASQAQSLGQLQGVFGRPCPLPVTEEVEDFHGSQVRSASGGHGLYPPSSPLYKEGEGGVSQAKACGYRIFHSIGSISTGIFLALNWSTVRRKDFLSNPNPWEYSL